MVLTTVNAKPHGLALMLGWRRVLFTLGVSVLLGLLNTVPSSSPTSIVVGRALLVGLVAMLVFGLFEQWPARLPRWMARWALQLLGVVAAIPLGALLAYWLTTGGHPQFAANPARLTGFFHLCSKMSRPLRCAGSGRR